MRKAVAVVMAGAGIAAVLSMPGSARASTGASQRAAVSVASATPSCASGTTTPISDEGNNLTAWDNGSSLIFDDPGKRQGETQWCFKNLGDGAVQIVDPLLGHCLAVNDSLGVISAEGSAACGQNGGQGYLWDQWLQVAVTPPANSGELPGYIYENVWNLDCIYDYNQEPAIFTTCNFSTSHPDYFFWMSNF